MNVKLPLAGAGSAVVDSVTSRGIDAVCKTSQMLRTDLFILSFNIVNRRINSLHDPILAQSNHDFINAGADGFSGQRYPQRLGDHFKLYVFFLRESLEEFFEAFFAEILHQLELR